MSFDGSAFANPLELALLHTLFSGSPYTYLGPKATSTSQVYLALFENNPQDTGAGTESTGRNYSRQPIQFTFPEHKTMFNSASIVFGPSQDVWNPITYLACFSASTSGSLLFYGKASASVVFSASGLTYTVNAGELYLSLQNCFSTNFANFLLYAVARNNIESGSVSASSVPFGGKTITTTSTGSILQPPRTITVGLLTRTTGGSEDPLEEITFSRYRRFQCTKSKWVYPTTDKVQYSDTIYFENDGNTVWQPIDGVGVFYGDAISGSLMFWKYLSGSLVVHPGDTLYITGSALTVTFDTPGIE